MAKTPFLLLFFSLLGVVWTPQILAATDTVELTRVDMSAAVETVPEPEPEPEPALAVPVIRNYNITAVTGQIVANPSNYDIYRTGKFIYAHNTAGLLGSITSLGNGETFTLTENGVVKTYRVAFHQIYELNRNNRMLNGDKNLTKDVEIRALDHSISMMTCTGSYVPEMGTSSHRWVVFADQI